MSLRLVFHVGLNKSGSTSLQNALFENKQSLLQKYGLYYEVGHESGSFKNHHALYKLFASSKVEEAQRYLQKYISDAISASADTALISSEDLFFLTSSPERFSAFIDVLKALEGVRIEIFLLTRPFKSWARSYIMQLVANGAFCINDEFEMDSNLANFLADGVHLFDRAFLPMVVANLRIGEEPGGLVNNVMHVLGFPTTFDDFHDNATGASRYFTAELLTGMTCGLRARIDGVHPNAPDIDILRDQVRSYIDERSTNHIVSQILNFFESYLNHDIDRLIQKSIDNLSVVNREILVKYDILDFYSYQNQICSVLDPK